MLLKQRNQTVKFVSDFRNFGDVVTEKLRSKISFIASEFSFFFEDSIYVVMLKAVLGLANIFFMLDSRNKSIFHHEGIRFFSR